MKNVVCVYKPATKTPLECIQLFKKQYPEYKDATISYAGRLDPMAEGLLVLLVGDENKKRQHYENLTKTYEFDILLGVTTDTYDILGKVQLSSRAKRGDLLEKIASSLPPRNDIQKILSTFTGKHDQHYPPYSSKAVQGKPLYWWARNNRLDEIQIPKKQVTITKLDLLKTKQISMHDLRNMIYEKLQKVQGDFRQKAILKDWESFFSSCHLEEYHDERSLTNVRDDSYPFSAITCTVTCSSGTYVRSLAHQIGEKVGCGAIALRIVRTQVGQYTLKDILRQEQSSAPQENEAQQTQA